MRERLSKPGLCTGILLGVLALPLLGTAQDVREVISNRLTISSGEAALHLEFGDDGTLDISFLGGEIEVDGRPVGSYTRGDELDTAWRALLGEVTTLDDGALALALRDWEPPAALADAHLEIAAELDRIIEEALEPVSAEVSIRVDPDEIDISIDASRLLASLLRSQLIPALSEALEEVQIEGAMLHIDEDVELRDRVMGSVVIVEGHLLISDVVEGDVVVIQGSLTLDSGAEVRGDVKLLGSQLYHDGGVVEGEIVELDEDDLRERIRDEVEGELRSEFRSEMRDEIRRTAGRGMFSPFARVTRGIGALFEDLITFAILAAIGLCVVFAARENLEVVAETARRSPARAGLVGLAGGFLVLPTYVLGGVALLVSVVGIIALPFWLFLFPLAVVLAAGLGYYAVAKNLGEWVADQELSGLARLRSSNTAHAVMAGVGTLVMFSVASNIMAIVPGLGFFGRFFATLGSIALFAVMCVGFGAVLLTRGGRQREYYDEPYTDGDWSEASPADVVVDVEELAEDETPAEPAPDTAAAETAEAEIVEPEAGGAEPSGPEAETVDDEAGDANEEVEDA